MPIFEPNAVYQQRQGELSARKSRRLNRVLPRPPTGPPTGNEGAKRFGPTGQPEVFRGGQWTPVTLRPLGQGTGLGRVGDVAGSTISAPVRAGVAAALEDIPQRRGFFDIPRPAEEIRAVVNRLRAGAEEFAKPASERQGLEQLLEEREVPEGPGVTIPEAVPLVGGRRLTTRGVLSAVAEDLPFGALGGAAKLTKVRRLNRVLPRAAATAAAPRVETAADKIARTVKELQTQRPEIERLRTAERAQRTAVFRKGRLAAETVEELGAAKAAFAGELPRARTTPPQVTPEDIHNLKFQLRDSTLQEFEFQRASDALDMVLLGDLPGKADVNLLRKVFGDEFAEMTKVLAPLSKRQQVLDLIGIPRAVMSSADLSAPLRQGVIFSASRPYRSAVAFKSMMKALTSEKYATAVEFGLRRRPLAQIADEAGLFQAPRLGPELRASAREEAFMTNMAQKIPVLGPIIRASERSYVTYLNKLRADVFDDIASKWQRAGLDLAGTEGRKELKALATWINRATGRGDLPMLSDDVSAVLNALFFSPRFVASRFQVANPVALARMPRRARAEAARDLVSFIGVGTTVLTIAAIAGADVEIDPRSSDFGKIRMGNTRLDPWGGFQQLARYGAQLATRERKATTTRQISPIAPPETALRFVRSKLAPVPSVLLDLYAFGGKDFVGRDVEFSAQEGFRRTAPLFLQDMYEAFEDEGELGLLKAAPGALGVGVSIFQEEETPGRKNRLRPRVAPSGSSAVNRLRR